MKQRIWFLATFLAIGSFVLPAGSQTAQAPASPEAQEILKKTLAAYAAAKTYQGTWTYTEERGTAVQKTIQDIRVKAPNRLSFKVTLAPGQKPVPGMETIPDTRVVIDGKTAWFENTAVRVFYKVPVPKKWQVSPEIFIPQVRVVGDVERKDDLHADGKTIIVLQAKTADDSTTRMEIESGTFHIRRIVREVVIGLTKSTSTITVDKETFDAEVPDNSFSFKPAKGLKEMPAPPETAALFGVPG